MDDFFDKVFGKQITLQRQCNKNLTKTGSIVKVYGHATAAIIEICEMLQADTSWKKTITGSKKSPVVDSNNFKEEWADAFLYLINAAIYKGLTIDEIKEAVKTKQEINFIRMNDNGGSDING